jgi:hypothetical protein
METCPVHLPPARIADTSSPSRPSPSHLSVLSGMKRKRVAGDRSLSQSSVISISSDSGGEREAKTNQFAVPKSNDLAEWAPTVSEPCGQSIEEPRQPVPQLGWCIDPYGPGGPLNNQPSPHIPHEPSIEQPANLLDWCIDPYGLEGPPNSQPLPDAPYGPSIEQPSLPANQPLAPLPVGDLSVPKDKPNDEPVLCKEQQDLVNLIVGNRNVFYTGSAGCGKSTVLKAVVRRLRDMDLKVDIVAPTGRAALQVDGRSTWTYMGWTPDYHKFSRVDL